MLFSHWNESMSTRLMQAMNHITVIVLCWNKKWIIIYGRTTLRGKKNFGTMGLLIFSCSMYLWPLFDINYWESLPSSSKTPHSRPITRQYWQWQYREIIPQCYLSHCGLFSMSVHSFKVHVIQCSELSEEGHTCKCSGNCYLFRVVGLGNHIQLITII